MAGECARKVLVRESENRTLGRKAEGSVVLRR